MKKYDLIVLGGGLAGCAAAAAAARNGMHVLLAEKSNALGGAANTCLVNPFMPYYTKIDSKRYDLSAGFFKEITGELEKCGAYFKKKPASETEIFNEEYLKLILNRKLTECGADILFHAFLTDADTADNKITSVKLATKSGILTFAANHFIDATGDGDLAYITGCPYHLGRESDNLCQPMTLCFRMGNVDIDLWKQEYDDINVLYKQFQKQGKIKNVRENVLVFQNVTPGVLHFNSTRIVKLNPTDVFDVTKAEIEAREQVFELADFLKANFKAFENAEVISTASQIGVRESRMIDGMYTLTRDDLIACTKFEDSVALGNYDIDIHNPEGSGTDHYYFKEGEFYTIPYRCLVPRKYENLLVAGRCISATHDAQASIRIMPIVCCLGEAAGYAASIAAQANVSMAEVDIHKLRKLLRDNGCAV